MRVVWRWTCPSHGAWVRNGCGLVVATVEDPGESEDGDDCKGANDDSGDCTGGDGRASSAAVVTVVVTAVVSTVGAIGRRIAVAAGGS